MNVDFLKQPIKEGDYVACLDKHYQSLRYGQILRLNDKTILVALVDSEAYFQKELIKAFHANVANPAYPLLNGGTYRTIHDAVVLIPQEQLPLMDKNFTENSAFLKEFVEAYNHYRPEKPVSKGSKKKSSLKI